MARHIDPVCRLCRREGIKLYLKGSRCESPKCAIERRNQPPGMHVRRGKLTEYGERLREKQKLKRFYGVLERQFRRGFAPSRAAARQLVAHGHILLNGKNCNIPSLTVKKGDKIAVKNKAKSLAQVKLNQTTHTEPIPDFLEIVANDPPEGMMKSIP